MVTIMIRFLRWVLLIIGIVSLSYSTYKYIENPSNLYYIIGGVGAVIAALCGVIEVKKTKEKQQGIRAGDKSNILIISGDKNNTNIGG